MKVRLQKIGRKHVKAHNMYNKVAPGRHMDKKERQHKGGSSEFCRGRQLA
jgi:hypothetical protein